MRQILKYFTNYKKETVLAPLFKLLEAVFELFVPLVIAGIIDKGIPTGDKGYVGRMFAMLVLLAIIGLICAVTAQFFAAKAATGVSTKLRSALFARIEHLSFRQIDEATTSTLITRMTSDINQVQSGINMVLRLFLRSPIIVFGAVIMAFTIDVKSAFIFVITVPALAVVVVTITAMSIPRHKKVQGALDKVLGATRENLAGARVIRAFRREDNEKKDFAERTLTLYNLQNNVGFLTSIMNPATLIIIDTAIVILIYFGAIRVDTGVLTQGQVVALWNYMSQILVELVKLANLVVTVTKALACAERVGATLSMEEEEPFEETVEPLETDPDAPAVEFQNVSLTYHEGAEPSLKNISFKVNHGDVVGVIGGTGSGKTSLVHLIPGFYKASEGRVLVDGREVSDFTRADLRKRVSVAMQKAVLFKGSIRSNILKGNKDATDEEILEAAKIAQAYEIIEGKGGLDASVAQGGKNFSGGQKQRLALTRALISKPEILILDDSASALDFATEAALRKALTEKMKGTTMFIVSQRTSSIMHADKIIVLEDGEAVGIGTHKELLKTCEIYREIFLSQFPERAGEIDG